VSAASWNLAIEAGGRTGAENMATDLALLRAAQEGQASLRLYRWSPPCLSFGRNEPARSRYDLEKIRALGLDTVRRPTGGRAVWHDRELTYALAAPTTMFGSLQEAYITIHQMLAEALRRVGAPVDVARRPSGRTPGPGGGACFAAPVGGEIVAGGLKLVGSAQVREGDALLQHGSLLLENGQDVVTRVTVGPRVAPAATSLSTVLGRPVVFDEVADAIAETAKASWGGTWTAVVPACSAEDVARFADPDWTLRR